MSKAALLGLIAAAAAFAQPKMTAEKEAAMKADLAGQIDAMKKQAQVMVDSVFSFGELGFQEFETTKYLTGILEKEGFKIERGIAGIPTAWVATWGSGKPVISLGSDIDDIPQASQKPGVAWHEPMIEGAPGHGEGHNSGVPLNIIAALAVKKVMEREHLQGTIQLWPGVAEEAGRHQGLLRARRHVQGRRRRACSATWPAIWASRWGPSLNQNGLVSVEYMFKGESAHAAGAPWRGQQRARRGGTDGRRLEFPPRASAPGAALALRDHQRRRPAQRGAAQRHRLVLLPRGRLRPHHEHVAHRRQHGQGRHADDRHHLHLAPAGQRLARPLQPADRRRHVREHQEGGAAAMVGRRPDAGEGAADGAEGAGARPGHNAFRSMRAAARRRRTPARDSMARRSSPPAAAPTISATSLERADRDAALSRRTFPAARDTTGPTASPWPRPSRTKAWSPAPRCRP